MNYPSYPSSETKRTVSRSPESHKRRSLVNFSSSGLSPRRASGGGSPVSYKHKEEVATVTQTSDRLSGQCRVQLNPPLYIMDSVMIMTTSLFCDSFNLIQLDIIACVGFLFQPQIKRTKVNLQRDHPTLWQLLFIHCNAMCVTIIEVHSGRQRSK